MCAVSAGLLWCSFMHLSHTDLRDPIDLAATLFHPTQLSLLTIWYRYQMDVSMGTL